MCIRSIDFPVECFEDIFGHLSGSELLECTLVSPYWEDLITSTRSCMKKIKFKMVCWHGMSDHQTKVLMKSHRKYTSLKLTGNFSESSRKLLSPIERRWTHVSATALDFKSDFHFLEFLRIFESSVEHLDFTFGKVKADCGVDFESADLQFS